MKHKSCSCAPGFRSQGGQQTLEDPEKPRILFAPGKIPWKTMKLQPNPEKLCSEVDFPRISFWPCSAATFFIPVTQGRRIYEIIGGKSSVSLSCDKQPLFSNSGNKTPSKAQNERWIGTGRRYMCDDYIFRKHSEKYPGKPLKYGRKSPRKPWKRISFLFWPP